MIYAIIFIGFLVAVHFISKMNKGMIDTAMQTGKQENPFPKLAEHFGLQFEDRGGAKTDGKTIQDMDYLVHGEYRGLPIEIKMALHTQNENAPIGYMSAYSYTMDRKITFNIKNADNKKFHIGPKTENLVSEPTGRPDFDDKLALTGDKIVSDKFLNYSAELGWMNLKLDGQKLVLNDDFMDQFAKGGFGSMQMLTKQHPIWKTTPQNQTMDFDSVKKCLDQLVDLIEESKLN